MLAGSVPGLAQPGQPEWLAWPSKDVPDFHVLVFDQWDPDGDGPGGALLAVGGSFGAIGNDIAMSRIATWDGASWGALGAGVYSAVFGVASFDDGAKVPSLYVTGHFKSSGETELNHIARWADGKWQPCGSGLDDDGEELFAWNNLLLVSGWFKKAGGVDSHGLAAWTGNRWQFPFPDPQGPESSFALYNGSLFAGGLFIPGCGVIEWNGVDWTLHLSGPTKTVRALCVYRGRLYACGQFQNLGNGQPASNIAVFDGSQWQPVSGGLLGSAACMTVFDPDGPGPLEDQLIVGGFMGFANNGQLPVNRIAAWNGEQWSALGEGLDGGVRALATYQGRLVVGGEFKMAGGKPSPYIALWGCPSPCSADCDASGGLDVDDLICFQTLFGLNDAKADCDSSGSLDIDDFVCFQTAYGRGCR